MTVPICPHWISANRGNLGTRTDAQIFAEWQPEFVKIVCNDIKVPYLEDVPSNSKIVVRHYPLSELFGDRGIESYEFSGIINKNWYHNEGSGRDKYGNFFSLESSVVTPETVALQHAQLSELMAQYCEYRGVARNRLLFEGINEPMLWSTEGPEFITRYEKARLRYMHERNLNSVIFNFGVGWPGNGGVQNSPVQWETFEPAILAMRQGDFVGLHEYCDLLGVDNNWGWWMGRFTQCPYNVPILITETGIDCGVSGNFYKSWKSLPGEEREKAQVYTDLLLYYWNKCLKDGRVKAIFPFTYDRGSNEWAEFDIRTEMFINVWFNKKHLVVTNPNIPKLPVSSTQPEVPVVDKIGNTMLEKAEAVQVIRINPTAALAKAIRKYNMWVTSDEFSEVIDGIKYIGQRAENPDTGSVSVFYVKENDYGNVIKKDR